MLRKCYPNIRPFMRQNIAFILLTECVVALTLIVPLIIRFLIDDVLGANQWDRFTEFVIFMGLAIIISRTVIIIEHNFSDTQYFQKVFVITGYGKVERTK